MSIYRNTNDVLLFHITITNKNIQIHLLSKNRDRNLVDKVKRTNIEATKVCCSFSITLRYFKKVLKESDQTHLSFIIYKIYKLVRMH